MKIKNIKVTNGGWVNCYSRFYFADDIIPSDSPQYFTTGINKLYGEIDSGVWAISYLLSMYLHKKKNFILHNEPNVVVNDNHIMTLKDFSKYSCYLDESYPLFSSKRTVRELVTKGLRKTKSEMSADEIRDIFALHVARFERPISQVGNEIFRTMAAIGYSYGKEVYCLPWLSKKRFKYYQGHMDELFKVLTNLEKIVIVPVGE